MFTKAERLISLRNLRPKKKEGFLKIISIFSFLGIMLGVAILIIVMSVMNGFKTDLTNKILGLNPHIVIQPNGFKINDKFIEKLKDNFKEISLSKSYFGEGIIISNDNAITLREFLLEQNQFNLLGSIKKYTIVKTIYNRLSFTNRLQS